MSQIEDYGYSDFEIIKEEWNEYRLTEDNSVVRIKAIPLKFIREDSGLTINESNIIVVFSPKELKGRSSSKRYSPQELNQSIKKADLGFEEISEGWNEYKLSDGTKVRIKSILTEISSTDKCDGYGEPIYIAQIDSIHKITSAPETSE